jgi:DNA-binding transcriptional ArsR family regulator
MSIDSIPDYELVDQVVVTDPAQLRAMGDRLRGQILDLLLERAATVAELAEALDRPKSTVAHHVNVLLDAELLKVVRTRRVRAIDERFYGRTARVFQIGAVFVDPSLHENGLSVAAAESVPAHEADDLRTILRHARIPHDRAAEFWERVLDLSREFAQIPREGETVYGFAAGLYPSDHPSLPD